jgi:GNS1/SUR4 family
MEYLLDARGAVAGLDSGAAATSVADLFTGVSPRHPLMAPWAPYVVVALYLGLKPLLVAVTARVGTTGRSLPFRAVALAHNVALCAFSCWTAVNIIPLTFRHMRAHGVVDTYCDHALWESGLGYWGFLFYLSKVWELVDTALLVVKRREPSYLQVYQ